MQHLQRPTASTAWRDVHGLDPTMCSDVDVGAQALESREDTTEMETPPMAELVDAPDSESGDESHASSRLAWGTTVAALAL